MLSPLYNVWNFRRYLSLVTALKKKNSYFLLRRLHRPCNLFPTSISLGRNDTWISMTAHDFVKVLFNAMLSDNLKIFAKINCLPGSSIGVFFQKRTLNCSDDCWKNGMAYFLFHILKEKT